MHGNNSTTDSGSTYTSPKPSLSNARKLKLYKAERKLKQITTTLAAQTLATKTDPNLEQDLNPLRERSMAWH